MPDSTQDRNHVVTWVQARTMITAHRSTPGVSAAAIEGAFGGAFKKADVVALLSQPGCAYLRIYYGRNSDGTPAMVLLAVDADRHDMTGGVVLDNHFPCPPWCPPAGGGV